MREIAAASGGSPPPAAGIEHRFNMEQIDK
jgi:hypothetical protein